MFLMSIGFFLALVTPMMMYFLFDFKLKIAAFSGLAVIGLTILLGGVTIIPAGHVGVQVTVGSVHMEALTEGVHFVNPISVIKDVDVRLQKAELKAANAGTKDLQVVHTDIVVNYRLNNNKVPHIFKEFGLNVDEKVLGPGISEAFKSVTGHFTSEELITKRDIVSQDILDHLKSKMAPFNIDVSGISLVNFGFSEDYQKAIEAKVISVQQTAKAQQDLERVKIEAASRIAEAKGEAEAIAIQAQAINSQGGAAFVQLEAIKKWNGTLPATMMGQSVPFVNVK